MGKLEARVSGFDEAVMLDPQGFVSTCNSTNFFIVRSGQVWTSTGNYCLNGITRGNIIDLCQRNEIEVYEKDFSLFDVYSADEAFVTGTFGGVAHVAEVDGRRIGDGNLGSTTGDIKELYTGLLEEDCPVDNG